MKNCVKGVVRIYKSKSESNVFWMRLATDSDAGISAMSCSWRFLESRVRLMFDECVNEPQNGCSLQILLTHIVIFLAGAPSMQSTCGAAQLGIGAVTGFAFGTLLLGMAIMAFILLGIPRSVMVIYTSDIPKEWFHRRFPKIKWFLQYDLR